MALDINRRRFSQLRINCLRCDPGTWPPVHGGRRGLQRDGMLEPIFRRVSLDGLVSAEAVDASTVLRNSRPRARFFFRKSVSPPNLPRDTEPYLCRRNSSQPPQQRADQAPDRSRSVMVLGTMSNFSLPFFRHDNIGTPDTLLDRLVIRWCAIRRRAGGLRGNHLDIGTSPDPDAGFRG